jgi:AcrR family transcriptional regulator
MTSMESTKAVRPLRRDAAENRDRLLAAAAEVFDAHGLDASVADIARSAGVGMGTLYRRFPTKDALIDALVHDVLDATIRMARDAGDAPGGTGLEQFLEAASAFQAEHPGCLPRLWNTDHHMVRTARSLIAGLLSDAQRHGRIRDEVTSTDITMVMFSVRGILAATRPHAPDAWRRHLEFLIAGMRHAPEALTHPPLSQTCLDRILTTRHESAAESSP